MTRCLAALCLFLIVTPSKFLWSGPLRGHDPAQVAPSVTGDARELILGRWQFIGYIYRNAFHRGPNPNLVLTFDFFADGVNVLRWHRLNERGFCERKGAYTYSGEFLYERIFWVHPENAFECSRDPDMTVGRTQVTPLRRVGDHLHMDLYLSDETLTYVWAPRTEEEEENEEVEEEAIGPAE